MTLSGCTKISLLAFIVLGFSGCVDTCKVTSTYMYYSPVYSTSEAVRKAVAYEPPRKLSHLGKIYVKDEYLFINESSEGIHVIDNKVPASPAPQGFLKIPGNNDLAIIGDFLYADSYVDLVVFDIRDKSSIHEVRRIEGVFNHLQSYGYTLLTKDLVLTGWQPESTVRIDESRCENQMQAWGGVYYNDGIALLASAAGGVSAPSAKTGIGGSMATFTISQSRLYALDGTEMDIVNVSNPGAPVKGKAIEIGADTETLFPFKDKLFAGSRSGMYIYDLVNPDAPKMVSKYQHIVSCDPVVVNDTHAFVTLRSGNTCQGFTNQLEVISLANLSAPTLVKSYSMTNPYGLGIDKNLLFICDGSAGLKIFDAGDVNAIDSHMISQFPAANALDIIPFDNVAMMITFDGLYQYDYSDPKKIRAISKLPIVQ